MSRRVVIGKQNDGTFGLRVSLPGIDAYLGDSSGGDFSFDSAWTDIVKIALVGTCNVQGGSGTPGVAPFVPTVISHSLGYVPFVEARQIIGSLIYDDTMNLSNFFMSNRSSGPPAAYSSTQIAFSLQQSGPSVGSTGTFAGYSMVFVIYAIPVPNPS